jgi:hypothetical protein
MSQEPNKSNSNESAAEISPVKRPFQFSLRNLLLLALPTAIVALFARWMVQLGAIRILLFVGVVGICIGLAQAFCAEVLLLLLRDDKTKPCFRSEFFRSMFYSSIFIALAGILFATLITIMIHYNRLF